MLQRGFYDFIRFQIKLVPKKKNVFNTLQLGNAIKLKGLLVTVTFRLRAIIIIGHPVYFQRNYLEEPD